MFSNESYQNFKKIDNIVRINFLDTDLEDLLCQMDDYLDKNDIKEDNIVYIDINFEVFPFKKLSLFYRR